MDNPEQGGPVVAEAAAELPAVTEQAEAPVATEQAAESQPEQAAAEPVADEAAKQAADRAALIALKRKSLVERGVPQAEVDALTDEEVIQCPDHEDVAPADPTEEEQAAQIDHPGATDEQAAEMAANAEPKPAEDGDAFGPVVLPQDQSAEAGPLAEQIADVAAQAGDEIAAAEGEPVVSAAPEPAPVITRDLIRGNKMTPQEAAKAKVETFGHAVAEMARLKDQAGEVAALVAKHRDEAKARGDAVLACLLEVACRGLGATQAGLAQVLDEI